MSLFVCLQELAQMPKNEMIRALRKTVDTEVSISEAAIPYAVACKDIRGVLQL
jgi:hypothetical protein